MSLNRVIIVGRFGRDPDVKYTGTGTAVANFSLATDSTWKDNRGEKQTRTEWHRCTAWSKLASDVIGKYGKKGMLVCVEGRLQTREWEKDGVKHWTTEIVVENFRMLGGKNDRPADSNEAHEEPSAASKPQDATPVEGGESDIPW